MTPTDRPTDRPITLPAFDPLAAGETIAAYGDRAMRYALALDVPIFCQLDDTALESGADAVTHAVTQRDISPVTLACLQRLQREMRTQLGRRRAERDRLTAGLEAWLQANGPAAGETTEPTGDRPTPPTAGPRGGSPVRRPTPPTKPSSPAGMRPMPALQLGSDAF